MRDHKNGGIIPKMNGKRGRGWGREIQDQAEWNSGSQKELEENSDLESQKRRSRQKRFANLLREKKREERERPEIVAKSRRWIMRKTKDREPEKPNLRETKCDERNRHKQSILNYYVLISDTLIKFLKKKTKVA